jgi:hypothetical protein
MIIAFGLKVLIQRYPLRKSLKRTKMVCTWTSGTRESFGSVLELALRELGVNLFEAVLYDSFSRLGIWQWNLSTSTGFKDRLDEYNFSISIS